MTAGVLVLLFLGWQLWWNDALMARGQTSAAADWSAAATQGAGLAGPSQGARPGPTSAPSAPSAATPAPSAAAATGSPAVPVTPAVSEGTSFGVLYVPRFGPRSMRVIAEGVGSSVLNSTRLGVGHYPNTTMPGAVGNFAVAAHRSAYGGGLHLIDRLEVGDRIYVQTRLGWYTYVFRNLEYVSPSRVAVLNPTPGSTVSNTTERFITLTTCNPLYSTAERIIAYGVFEHFRPAADGAPVEIFADVAAWRS